MKTILDLTDSEKRLLLYAETCAVDTSGIYQSKYTNAEDREILDRWKTEGFLDHGSVASEKVTEHPELWVKLSTEATRLAHELRFQLTIQLWQDRKWHTTAEKKSLETVYNIGDRVVHSRNGEGVGIKAVREIRPDQIAVKFDNNNLRLIIDVRDISHAITSPAH